MWSFVLIEIRNLQRGPETFVSFGIRKNKQIQQNELSAKCKSHGMSLNISTIARFQAQKSLYLKKSNGIPQNKLELFAKFVFATITKFIKN